jgi:hypothetical protein
MHKHNSKIYKHVTDTNFVLINQVAEQSMGLLLVINVIASINTLLIAHYFFIAKVQISQSLLINMKNLIL